MIDSSGATERNCFISPDFVNSLTSELPHIDRRMSVLLVFFPVGSSGFTEGYCFISPDFVNSLISEQPYTSIEECQYFLSEPCHQYFLDGFNLIIHYYWS